MEGSQKYDEESLQHVQALLQKHDIPEILRMALDITKSRSFPSPILQSGHPNLPSQGAASVITSTSRSSHISLDAPHSAMSTNYTPSIRSSLSSQSRRPYELPLYRSGLNPTKPALFYTPTSSPTSDVFSPGESNSLTSPYPTDHDARSVASTNTRRFNISGSWFCTFCPDHKSFAAKADWKKHETRHHETGEDWPCPIRNCFQVFDRELEFKEHCERHHPDVPPPTDIKVRLLPRLVYGCGFDGCKMLLHGWKERCDHVAHHMKKEGRTRAEWRYSTMLHNLLRQDATRHAWKSLFSDLESKEPRYCITWVSENTRVLKQKLECCDMRPDVDVILHTALSLRSGRPFNDVVELDPAFKTPSQDSVPHFKTMSDKQLARIISGNRAFNIASLPINYPTALSFSASSISHTGGSADPHPGSLVTYDIATSPSLRRISRISYMDIDTDFDLQADADTSIGLHNTSDPQIPPGLDLDPLQMSTATPPQKPFHVYYAPTEMPASSTPRDEGNPRRLSRGHLLRHLKSRSKSSKSDVGT